MGLKKCSTGVWAIALILLVLIADQAIKVMVKTHMFLFERIEVMPWFHISFTENSGMAFGMEFVGTWILAIFRLAAIFFFCIYLRRLVQRKANKGFVFAIALIVAGAIGNLIDNCLYGLIFTESLPAYVASQPAHFVEFGHGYASFFNGRVVDMFYFPLFEWPTWMPIVGGSTFFGAIFNLADAAVTTGAIIILLFYSKLIFSNKPEAVSSDEESK